MYCSCGRCLKPSQSTKKLYKKNFDALSIPGYVIRKSLLHGAKHGASERQRQYYKAMEMLQKARQPKHGGYKPPSMVDTKPLWKDGTRDDKYRKSMSEIGWTEEQIIQYDELALEDHSFFGLLSLSKEGVQGPNESPTVFR